MKSYSDRMRRMSQDAQQNELAKRKEKDKRIRAQRQKIHNEQQQAIKNFEKKTCFSLSSFNQLEALKIIKLFGRITKTIEEVASKGHFHCKYTFKTDHNSEFLSLLSISSSFYSKKTNYYDATPAIRHIIKILKSMQLSVTFIRGKVTYKEFIDVCGFKDGHFESKPACHLKISWH